MRWGFLNASTISEMNTGFSIKLLSGTWDSPDEILPDGSKVSAYEQAKMLRLGLEYAKESALEPVA